MISENGSNGAPKKPEAPHIYIGTPTHDNRLHVKTHHSLIELVGSNRYKITNNKVSGGGIHKARNNIIHQFLQSDAQKIMWIDSDVGFAPEHVHQLYNRNLPIVGMPYCHKKIGALDWSAKSLEGVKPDERGLQKLAAIGFGFVMVDRIVPEAIIKKFGEEIWYIEDWAEGQGEKKHDMFREGVVQDPEFGYPLRTYVTEDFYFCYLARKCGFEIFADCTSFVTHWDGGQCFPDKFSAPQPTAAPKVNGKMPEFVNEAELLTANR